MRSGWTGRTGCGLPNKIFSYNFTHEIVSKINFIGNKKVLVKIRKKYNNKVFKFFKVLK